MATPARAPSTGSVSHQDKNTHEEHQQERLPSQVSTAPKSGGEHKDKKKKKKGPHPSIRRTLPSPPSIPHVMEEEPAKKDVVEDYFQLNEKNYWFCIETGSILPNTL